MIIEINNINYIYDKYFKQNHIKIGEGSEGEVYYLQNDNKALKIYFQNEDYLDLSIDHKNIITKNQMNLSSFVFPDIVYIKDGKIIALIQDYIPNDIFNVYKSIKACNIIDLKKLLESYKKMLLDVKKLTDKNLYLFELPNNLTYDKKTLRAIDTLDYYDDKENGEIDIPLYKRNVANLDYAINNELIHRSNIFERYVCNSFEKSVNDYINENGPKMKVLKPKYDL